MTAPSVLPPRADSRPNGPAFLSKNRHRFRHVRYRPGMSAIGERAETFAHTEVFSV
jgi:hypothetical protein